MDLIDKICKKYCDELMNRLDITDTSILNTGNNTCIFHRINQLHEVQDLIEAGGSKALKDYNRPFYTTTQAFIDELLKRGIIDGLN